MDDSGIFHEFGAGLRLVLLRAGFGRASRSFLARGAGCQE